MIEPNNPDIDVATLERRIEIERCQPELKIAPPLSAAGGGRLAMSGQGLFHMKLKLWLRGIPVLGSSLAALNRWQRRLGLANRLLSTSYLGYGLRWLKSLALTHETRGRLEMTVIELSLTEQRLRAEAERLRAEIALGDARLAELRQEAGNIEQRLQAALDLNLAHVGALRQEAADLKKYGAENRTEILFQQRRLTAALTALESASSTTAIAPSKDNVTPASQTGSLDSYYAAFEAAFRGNREEIKNRLGVYLDRVRTHLGDLPVLDIGCGRGEWIELLGEQAIKAYGVDLNSVFIVDARECGLDAREAEALAHLRSLSDSSLAGVTGFHIVEHLALHDLIAIVDEANRVLAPGGFVLFETPNPENLIVGASSFWNDPTHRAPLPPSVMRFMLEQRGFLNPELIYLHPAEEKLKLNDVGEIAGRLNQLLYGPMDYAIWARKA